MNAPTGTGADRRARALLVGRNSELSVLHRALARMLQGHGGLVLVSGEAGIGKTSLVQFLVAEAREIDTLVLSGGAYDLMSTPPYGPWLELTDRYPADSDLPALPDVLRRGAGVGDLSGQVALFEVTRDFFTEVAEARPLVIVLEDLHWADQASLDLLRYLSRYVEGERILLIATYRDDEISRKHPLFQLLPVLVRESEPDRIDLRALATSEIAELIALRYPLPPEATEQLARHLSIRSEGNPLFLIEMLRAMETDGLLASGDPRRLLKDLDSVSLPPLIRQVIEARVARLDRGTIDLLETAAVIGESVPVALWQQVSESGETPLSKAVAQAAEAHVITESGNASAVRFTHALIREVLYERIPIPCRRSLHRSTGDALVSSHGGDADEIAYHFQQGGDRRAIEWLIRAGIRARGQSAWLNAADRFLSAAEFLADDHQQLRLHGWLLFYAGYLLRFTTGEKSIECLQGAEQTAIASGDELLAAYALYCRGSTRSIRPTPEMRVGLVELRQGVTALEHLSGSHRWRSTDEQAEAMVQALLVAPGTDNSLETEAPERAREPVFTPQRGVLISRLAQAGHFLESLESGEDFVRRLNSEFDDTWRTNHQCLDAYSGLGNDYAAVGDPDAAKRAIATARTAYLAIGDHAMAEFMTWVELNMVIIPYQTDRLEERADLASLASAEWNRCREVTVSGGSPEAPARLILYELEGRWSEAWEIAEEQERSHPWKAYVAQAMLIKGRLACRRGDAGQAWESVNDLLPEGVEAEPGNSYFLTSFEALALAVDLCLDGGNTEEAHAWITARDRWLEWSGARLWGAENLLLWASYFRAAGDFERARHYATAALAEASEPRQPLTHIRINRLLGEIDTELNHHEAAVRWFEDSLAIAEACAAPYERALTLLSLAEHQVATRNIEGATTLIEDVRSICTPLDARPALARADAVEKLSAGRALPTSERSSRLTDREIEVLRLIARGRSNRQIADELFISTRTVERHIANIYTKIHVHNRAEATAFALRGQLI